MMRFMGQNKDGRTIIGLGITSANVARMAQGEPLRVKLEDFGLSGEKIDFMIFYGKDMETLQEQFAPMIGPDTKVHNDPLLDQVPEDARTRREGQNRGKV